MLKQRHWFIWLLLLTFSVHAEVTSVTATVDKNPVMLDEAITLTVTAEGDAEREAFDSSVLLSDFVVGRTSVSSQTSIINFDTRRTTTWSTTLFPRKVGTFTIPAFTIEGQKSAPVEVRVIPVQQGDNAPARDYYVSTEVNNDSVYLQQQLRYTVKLYLSSQIERGSLQAPELENAQIQQLGDDKQYTELVNGRRYQVVERNFAVLPQQSGTFTIRGPVFSGEVIAPNTNQRFGFFNRTQTINRVGPDVQVEVKPIPAEVDYHWLPSDFVQLDEEWQSDTFTVGEPVTRTLTLTAVGVVEEQLPEIEQIYPPDFKLYPDQANSASAEKDNRLIVQRTESVAMIPTKAGSYIIPEVRVPWFNVSTGKTEYAKLPSRTVNVIAAAVAAAGQSLAAAGQSSPVSPGQSSPALTPPQLQTDQPQLAEDQVPAQPATAETAPNEWDNLHTIMLALWLLTLIGWLFTYVHLKKRGPRAPSPTQADPIQATASASQLQQIVRQGDIRKIQPALNLWLSQFTAAKRWQIEQQIKPEVDAMMAAGYALQPGTWDPTALLNKLKNLPNQQGASGPGLAPLYPAS
ncbi:MAG: aerotolerance regulator BatD [Alteromonadaceae bacterium]|nr:aerotolerance regulator BatD [Alteromonadaceae bacterium]